VTARLQRVETVVVAHPAIISRTSEIFGPATGRFHEATQKGVRRHKHDCVALDDSRVFITGDADERDMRLGR
jgi:hypothetical protein